VLRKQNRIHFIDKVNAFFAIAKDFSAVAARRRTLANTPADVTIALDGARVTARAGESVAAALMASGHLALRTSPRSGAPRGAFCLMGVCQECVMRIDGVRQQACTVEVQDGMTVEVDA
jgi:sarcosine oxidase subunit alpha